MASIAEKIKHLRVENNLTQEDFAHKIGISRSNLAQIETGKTNPTFEAIGAICNVFKLDANYLIDTTKNVIDIVNNNVILKSRNDVIVNDENGPKQAQNLTEYMRQKAIAGKGDFDKRMADFYSNDPVGIKTKDFEKLKEKFTRRLNRELVKEHETLYNLSFLVDHLEDIMEMATYVYTNNINTRPNPFEVSQYYDYQKKTFNIPNTLNYDKYKENTIAWLSKLVSIEPVLKEFYAQNETFLERLNAFEQST